MTASGDSLGVQAGPPRTVGRYQLLEPLGRGGMGTVYRARQVQLEKLVAIKLLDPLIASGQVGVTRFMREARAAAQIHHPNVVEVFDVGFDDGVVFLAMELLEGQDLAALLRERKCLPLHEIVEILAPVLAGVRAAHEAGVVHRDLKPSNIFLARRGRTRRESVVLDFGVSRVLLDDELGLTPVTTSETMIGTAAYIAPEQARQSRLADARSDQYSLGVIMYECATGSRPFVGQSTYELLHSIATATVCPPSQRNPLLPVAFDELVLRALARDPEQRFEDLDGLARALMAFAAPRTWMAWGRELVAADWANGDDSPTGPPSQAALKPLPLPTPQPARSRGGLAVAFALGALLSGGAAALLRREPTSGEARSAQRPSTRLDAELVSSATSTRSAAVASSAPAALVAAQDQASPRKPDSSARSAPLRPPRCASPRAPSVGFCLRRARAVKWNSDRTMRRSSNRARRWLCALWVVLGLCSLALARPAFADEPSAELVAKGLSLRRERRDAEALQLFQRAFASSAKPMILAQIALAEQALGRWLSAEHDLTSALATHDGWIEANRGALEKALTVIQSHLSWLAVTTNVESAELWLDNGHWGTVRAAPWRVADGTHELELRLADGRSSTRSVQLAAGERQHFHVEFSSASPSGVDCPVPPPPRSLAPEPAKIVHSAPNSHKTSTRQAFAFGSAALAVGALAGAVTASLLRVNYVERYNSEACLPDRSKQCAAYRDIANTLGDVAVVGYVVAGTAALGSAALFTAPYWYPSTSSSGTQAGVLLSGQF